MNYLAHLYLSHNEPLITVGNFIADHVKGREVEKYSGGILEGIRLHRLIDAFTDSHPVMEESKVRLRAEFRKYAPVISDVFYDHFLARDWAQYHPLPLMDFSRASYALLRGHAELLPPRTLHMLHYMEAQDWLSHYASLDGMERSLRGLSRRASFASNMERAHLFLEKHYTEFEHEFNRFFPELRSYVAMLGEART